MFSLFAKNPFKSPKSQAYKLSLDLYLDNETVYLQGLDDDERAIASESVLRGVLNVNVEHSYLFIQSLKVRFVGKASDTHYSKDQEGKTLLKSIQSEIINDTYEYDTKTLLKGTYNFPFQFIVDPNLPESVTFLYGSRNYYIEVEITYDNKEVEVLAHRNITLVRCPLMNSPKYTEPIEARGCWNDAVPYDISIDSKLVILDQDFKVDIDVYPLQKDLDKSSKLKYIKLLFIQKTKCPQMNENMTEEDSVLAPKFFTVTHQTCLKTIEKFTPNEDGSIITNLKLNVPSICSNFKVHPYNSNPDDENSNNTEFSETIKDKVFRLSHYLQVTLGFDIHYKDSNEDTFKELTFKGKVHLLHPKIHMNPPPPAYDSNEFNYSPKITTEKSLTWLYTNGQLEMEQPPLYKNLMRLQHS